MNLKPPVDGERGRQVLKRVGLTRRRSSILRIKRGVGGSTTWIGLYIHNFSFIFFFFLLSFYTCTNRFLLFNKKFLLPPSSRRWWWWWLLLFLYIYTQQESGKKKEAGCWSTLFEMLCFLTLPLTKCSVRIRGKHLASHHQRLDWERERRRSHAASRLLLMNKKW